MSLGTGIFLIVVGAILTFALDVDLGWINLDLVGYLLMGAGVVISIVGIVLLVSKRRSVVEQRTTVDPANGDRVDRRETSYRDGTV